MTINVHHGDCRDVLAAIPAGFAHCCVTDPPYGFRFMGRRWDYDVPPVATWRAVHRVLRPGAYLVAFGGPRTGHRIATAIEDAGFELRDSLAWLFGEGMPKSQDIAKAIDKALGVKGEKRPTGEKRNRIAPGATILSTGDWHAGGGEYEPHDYIPATDQAREWLGWGTGLKPGHEPIVLARKPAESRNIARNVLAHGTGALNIGACCVPIDDADAGGRWPANVLHDGSAEVVELFPEAQGMARGVLRRGATTGRGIGFASTSEGHEVVAGYGDKGSAARFFYSAKATDADRADSKHPTVKPVALIRWLVRLVTPRGGMILDPFAGSGTTGEAAMLEGFDATLIEREAEHVAEISHRIARWNGGDLPLFNGDAPQAAEDVPLPLFVEQQFALK